MVLTIADKRPLTQKDLKRALLDRQLLLERSSKPIPKVLEAMGGLQAQYAPSMYIGLWSRMKHFERSALNTALERRTVVQGTLLRTTIHLVSARDYWPFVAGITDTRREWWLRTHKTVATDKEMRAAATKLRKALGSGTMRRADMEDLLGKAVAGGVGLWIDLVRVPPSGTWDRRRADLYAAADKWIDRPQISRLDGIAHLVQSYLRGFGPAPIADIASWAGLKPTAIRPALERMTLRTFAAEDGTELIDLRRGSLPEAAPVSARFLPTWDATLLVHARRTGILPERYRPRVFDPKTPHSVPVFLVDGAVAGTWKFEGGGVKIDPFERLSRSAMRNLRKEADGLEDLHR